MKIAEERSICLPKGQELRPS